MSNSSTYGIFDDWRKGLLGFVEKNQSNSTGFEDYTETPGSGTLDTAGGIKGSGINATINRQSESPLVKNPIFTKDNFKKVGSNIYNAIPGSDLDRKYAIKQVKNAKVPNQQGIPTGNMPVDNEENNTQISGAELSKDPGFMGKLANMAGVDLKKAAANWKEKGGFDGLMSNPAFSLGLALMQSSANGKTINQGILDNFVKSAKISSEFKDRIEARSGDVIEATEGQMNQIKSVLKTMGTDAPGWWRKLKSGNQTEMYEQAVEDVTVKVQQKVKKMKRDAKASGKDIVVGNRLYKKIIKEMMESGEIKSKGGVNIGGYQVVDKTLESRAQGGPIQQGKPYVVGEQGPEIIIPRSDGDVLTNDDSQIYAMLLASNPQLQKVSRVRAQKIMRNRFPEYFEG